MACVKWSRRRQAELWEPYLYTGTRKGYSVNAVALGGDKERRRGGQTPSECWCWRWVLRVGQEDSDTTASGEKLVFAL